MDTILKKLMNGAADAGSLARSIAESGLRSVSEVFRGTKIFGALSASSVENVDYDETHYVLVPLLGMERNYAIYTKRVLPPGIGVTNSLPKARIFHVPDETGKELLEQELAASIVLDKEKDHVGSSELADTLEKLADKIDRETNKMSGGLLLIGGLVAVVNPLMGLSLVAKGLLPSVGAKASKVGAEYLGNKLRDWKKSSAMSRLQKDVSKEVQNLKPQIYSNPIVRSLEAIATNPSADFDPVFDRRNWIDEFQPTYYYVVTLEAIREVYKDVWDSLDLDVYQESHIHWIRSFLDDTMN